MEGNFDIAFLQKASEIIYQKYWPQDCGSNKIKYFALTIAMK